MPKGDRTGPTGSGAMTGHQAGYCAGYQTPGMANPVPGRGFRIGAFRRRGARGHGWRNMFYATGRPGWMRYGHYGVPAEYPAPYQQVDLNWDARELRNQADMLQAELDHIKKRLAEIKSATES